MLETESAYYLYQPLEQLYLVMIATKTSNMVENLDCLHLLARIVLTAVPLPDEASIRDSMFDIKFKWDEAVTFGFPNHLTLDEITQNVQMYSYEEELSRKLLDEKRQAARRHIKAELTKAEEARRRAAGGQGSSILGFGETPALPAGHVGSMTAPFGTPAGDVDAGHPSSSTPIVSTPMGGASPSMNPAPSAPRPSGRKGGIKLSSRVALKPDAVESLKQDMGVSPAPPAASTSVTAEAPSVEAAAAAAPAFAGMRFVAEEKVRAAFDREGTCKEFSVSGELVATPGDASLAGASLRVAIQRPAGDPYVWKTHPVINKQSFAENVLTTAPGKPFPARVMKWRYDGPASSQLGPPLSVSVWGGDEDPDGNGMIAVTLEYELLRTAMTLHNVLLCMQCSGCGPEGPSAETAVGSFNYDSHSQTCSWSHAMIDRSTASGSIEIRMPQTAFNGLFPISVSFSSSSPYCPLEVSGVMAEAGPVPFVLEKALTTDVYSIGP
eukprot:GAFH01001330.1.p1 GENE.GAFH01001330.1~~GAFH01001330.1.p1  ORF type:complete len:543 (-),score=130.86 GAFH01001330.1:87-1571(-)